MNKHRAMAGGAGGAAGVGGAYLAPLFQALLSDAGASPEVASNGGMVLTFGMVALVGVFWPWIRAKINKIVEEEKSA